MSWAKGPKSTCSSSCAKPSRRTASGAWARGSTAPTSSTSSSTTARIAGKIIYDSKNRNAWQNEFVNKLRADKIAEGADHAILSSNKFPKDKREIHPQDGVIVASPARVAALAEILRGQVLRMHALRASGEEREQKTLDLYNFITSEHFKQLIDQVEMQTAKMLDLDSKEQEAHRRLWDQRNKLIRSVQKARSDLSFEVDRIIGTAGNGPEADEAA